MLISKSWPWNLFHTLKKMKEKKKIFQTNFFGGLTLKLVCNSMIHLYAVSWTFMSETLNKVCFFSKKKYFFCPLVDLMISQLSRIWLSSQWSLMEQPRVWVKRSAQIIGYDLAMKFWTYIYQESLWSEVHVTHFLVCEKYKWEKHSRLLNLNSNPSFHQLISLVLL